MNRPKKTFKKTAWSATWGGTKLALVMCCVLALNATAYAGRSKVSRDLDVTAMGSQPVDVIVQYKTSPDKKHFYKAAEHGAKVRKHLGLIKAALYTLPANQVAKLVEDDYDIKYVTPDRSVSGSGWTDGYVAVNTDVARSYGYDGSGVGVAVIDSGIGTHPDLKNTSGYSRVVYSQDFTGQGTTDDLYGHGTHVAGILGGNGKQSSCNNCYLTYMGVASNVNLVNLRVLDNNGLGTDSNVINAIQTAISLKSRYNIRVINLSLGRGIFESYTTDPLTQAVEQAWKAGIFVAVAAGNYGRDNSNNNNGYGTITSPGDDPYVITVGAMRTMGTQARVDDAIASYSSKGPSMLDHVVKPDIVAPGNQVVSSLAPNASLVATYPSTQVPISSYVGNSTGNMSFFYFQLSGTSMATPVVSGAAALLIQQNPLITPDQIKAKLMKTAFKSLPLYTTATDATTGITYNEQADIFTVGAGYLDIAAALNNTDLLSGIGTGSARSPVASYDSTTGQVTLVTNYSVLWGSSVLWGTSVLWGNSVVWGTSVIWGANTSGQSVLWGNSVCWGASTTSGFSVIWGSSTSQMSVLWGTSNTGSDASSVVWSSDK